MLSTPVFLDFLCGSAGKESACNVGDLCLILGLGRYPGEGKGYPLQYSGLEDSMDYIVHGVTKSWTGLSAFHFHILAVVNNAAFNMGVSVGISLSSNFTYFGYGDIPRMELLDVQSFYFKFFVGPPFCFP